MQHHTVEACQRGATLCKGIWLSGSQPRGKDTPKGQKIMRQDRRKYRVLLCFILTGPFVVTHLILLSI